jgi:hypothetical protein
MSACPTNQAVIRIVFSVLFVLYTPIRPLQPGGGRSVAAASSVDLGLPTSLVRLEPCIGSPLVGLLQLKLAATVLVGCCSHSFGGDAIEQGLEGRWRVMWIFFAENLPFHAVRGVQAGTTPSRTLAITVGVLEVVEVSGQFKSASVWVGELSDSRCGHTDGMECWFGLYCG